MKRMKTAATISLVCIYLCCLALILLRWIHIFVPEVVVITREITSHISNFALTLLGCLLIGFLLLSFGRGRLAAILLCVLAVAVNFLYEAFLPFLNTPDGVDAVCGAVGAVLAMLCLLWLEGCGFEQDANKTQ